MVTAATHCFITSADGLREIIRAPDPDGLVMRKQLPTLDAYCRNYIAKSPFLLLGTSGASGRCDVTPRGDGPGFVLVLDDNTLAIPDRPGNHRVDSMLNIVENPHVGLLFLVPGIDETLRVNGRAGVTDDANLLGQMTARGKTPQLSIVVEVEEVFFHCARAFKRSKLWESDSWIERSELPSLGRILVDQVKADYSAEELDRGLEESNRNLY